MAGTVSFQTLPTTFFPCSFLGLLARPPLWQPLSSPGQKVLCVDPATSPDCTDLNWEADKQNRNGRDLGSLEGGRMGSPRSSCQGLRIQRVSRSQGEGVGPPANVLMS